MQQLPSGLVLVSKGGVGEMQLSTADRTTAACAASNVLAGRVIPWLAWLFELPAASLTHPISLPALLRSGTACSHADWRAQPLPHRRTCKALALWKQQQRQQQQDREQER